MSEESPVGVHWCVTCRGELAPDVLVCPNCPAPAAAPVAEAPTSPAQSPFVLGMTIAILLLFVLFYNPRNLQQERGKPMPMKSKLFGKQMEEWQGFADELRGKYIEAYGGPAPRISIEQLRGMIEDRLKDVDRDPNYTAEQRAEIRKIIDRALRDKGF